MMELTTQQERMMKGQVCPYCKQETELVESTQVYGGDYGTMMYVCWDCGAHVGCHKGTIEAKGRLANKDLRQLKKQAHEYFDELWKSKKMGRNQAYKWLSKQLSIPAEYTHIGMFGKETCRKVIELCKNQNQKL